MITYINTLAFGLTPVEAIVMIVDLNGSPKSKLLQSQTLKSQQQF
jgi:hypothetical protein